MQSRLNAHELVPEIYAAARKLHLTIEEAGLDHRLIELVKIRASQINGCAFCLDMHCRDARKLGETNQRLDVLAGWRESPAFDARERAALAWTEALTLMAERGAPQALFDELKAQFSDREIAALTGAIGMINFWNRLAVGFHTPHPLAGRSG